MRTMDFNVFGPVGAMARPAVLPAPDTRFPPRAAATGGIRPAPAIRDEVEVRILSTPSGDHALQFTGGRVVPGSGRPMAPEAGMAFR